MKGKFFVLLKGNHFYFPVLIAFLLASAGSATAQNSALFESFNKANTVVLGIPSTGGSTAWTELETTGSNNFRARIENNALVFSTANNTGATSSGIEQVAYHAGNTFATTFEKATGDLNWSFNFRQSKTGPTGFGSSRYGTAFILGCTEANFSSVTASGYAVVLGGSSTTAMMRLVRFTNGLNVNSNLTTIVNSTEINATDYYSVSVSYDPCQAKWSLLVRKDGPTGFSDPAVIPGVPATATDRTFTHVSLPFTGAAFNHGTVKETAVFDNISLPTAQLITSDIYTWTGSLSTDFQAAGNWNPARTCNRTTDILKFNSGQAHFITNVATQNISSLEVANNTEVTLRPKTGAKQTLTILNGLNTDLKVSQGASLIFDGNDILEMVFSAGATASISGTVTFQNTDKNVGRAHRILSADAGALVFESGSKFIARNLSGEAFGNNGTPNTVIFKTGSAYISRDGASPFGLVAPNSKVVFQTGSKYQHEQLGTVPKFDGRNYADFVLNISGQSAILFGNNLGSPTTFDNFIILSGTLNFTMASNSNPLPLTVNGNLQVLPGGVFNYSPVNAAASSVLKFSGSATQHISGAVTIGQFSTVEVNNTAGLQLQNPLDIKGNLNVAAGSLDLNGATLTLNGDMETAGTIAGNKNSDLIITGTGKSTGTLKFKDGFQQIRNLTINRTDTGIVNLGTNLTVSGVLALQNGVVEVAAGNVLTLANKASILGGSANSFISGSIAKTGNTAFTFPTGKDTVYAPVSISAPTDTLDTFTAEYFNLNPANVFGKEVSGDLKRISEKEYWKVEKTAGNSDVNVTLVYEHGRCGLAGDPEDLRIATFEAGTGWRENTNAGNQRTSGTNLRIQASSGAYTFGSVSSFDPLPVTLLSFGGRMEMNAVKLTWQTATEQNNLRFDIERSTNGKNFEKIGEVKGVGNSNAIINYDFSDKKPVSNVNYYRLKQIDLDGKLAYSKTIAVEGASTNNIVRLYPNPGREKLTVVLPASNGTGFIKILNQTGLEVKVVKTAASGLENEINIEQLPAGIYNVLVTGSQKPVTTRFVKMN